MPLPLSPSAAVLPAEVVAASLLTSAAGAEVHLVGRDGQLMRLNADETTARRVALLLWRALDSTG